MPSQDSRYHLDQTYRQHTSVSSSPTFMERIPMLAYAVLPAAVVVALASTLRAAIASRPNFIAITVFAK